MLFNLKEFESIEEYNRWLTIMGERVKVISMTTLHKRWYVEDGIAKQRGTPLYLVTYKEIEVPGLGPPALECKTCGVLNSPRFRYCGNCGTPLRDPTFE